MNCPNCNTPLLNTYVCPKCGHKDELARKIIFASNWHYNQGLSKAKVRDLTGATNSLLMSLKYNKRNTQARNLLGLVYYQTGELVAALGEWVISMHFQKKNNIAGTYIRAVQNNSGKLQFANKTIQKYNTALEYLHQGNMDVAIIELKKVINLNPNYIKAYQLMGLLYLKTKQYAAARKVLLRALKIDRNNITSLRYLEEINRIAGEKAKVKVKKRDGFTQINDPNPVVIEEKKDSKYTDFNTGLLSIVNVIIGVVIGAAVIWLLVVPSVKRSQATQYNQAIVEYGSQITEKNKLLSSLNKEVEDLQAERDLLQSQLDVANSSQSDTTSDEKLLEAVKAYMGGDQSEAGVLLAEISQENLTTQTAKEIYDTIYQATKGQTESSLAAQGLSAYQAGEYQDAIDYYEKVLKLNASNVNALYYIASSYQSLADLTNAEVYYNKIITDFPDSELAGKSQEALDKIHSAAGQNPSGDSASPGDDAQAGDASHTGADVSAEN